MERCASLNSAHGHLISALSVLLEGFLIAKDSEIRVGCGRLQFDVLTLDVVFAEADLEVSGDHSATAGATHACSSGVVILHAKHIEVFVRTSRIVPLF